MKKSGKKIVLIILILLVIVIFAVGITTIVLMKNGTIAITKQQKLSRGLTDIQKNINDNNYLEDMNKLINDNVSKTTTTLTANTDTMELKYFQGYDSIIEEIKKLINELQIQIVTEKDLSNSSINANFSIKDEKVIENFSGELNYNKEAIGIRIKELNDKYLVVDQDNETTEIIFHYIDSIINIDKDKILLSNDEKQYFIDNYKNIFTENITIDMINEEKTTINVNGKDRECSKLYTDLNKEKIIIILGQIMKKLESDTRGKEIILSKINSLGINYTEADLYSIISNIRMQVSEIDENANVRLKMFCTYTQTLGLEVEMLLKDKTIKIKNMFENDYNFISINEDDKINFSIVNTNNDIYIDSKIQSNEKTMSLTYKQVDKVGQGNIQISEATNKKNFKIDINTNFNNSEESTITLKTQYKTDDDNVIIMFNINNKKEYINKVITPTYNNENSINIETSTKDEKIEYINTAFDGFYNLIADVTENSRLIRSYYNYYDVSSIIELFEAFITDKITSQDVLTFNNQFTDYIGEQTGENVELLYQKVNKSNTTETNNEHQVVWECSYEMSEILNIEKYNISAEYDNDGYINKIVVTE